MILRGPSGRVSVRLQGCLGARERRQRQEQSEDRERFQQNVTQA
jgi:hypothetical protein